MRLRGSPIEVVHALEVRWNRALVSRRLTQRELADTWAPVGDTAPLDRLLPGAETAVPGCSVVITTCNRADPCHRVLQALARQQAARGVAIGRVIVLDDASHADYSAVHSTLAREFAGRGLCFRARRNHGRSGFWRLYQFAFALLESLPAGPVLFVQDDLELAPGFWPEAWRTWQEIADPRKAVLSLCAMDDDEVNGRWVDFKRVEQPGQPFRLTQWFDLQAFLVERPFFELLRYQMFPVHPNRWQRRPSASSGVGAQLTRRLWRRANIYQVVRTLVRHGAEPSMMNPEARSRRTLDNRGQRRVPPSGDVRTPA
jgi:hypothetical protein